MKKELSIEENNTCKEVENMLDEEHPKPTNKSGDFILLFKLYTQLNDRLKVLEKK